MFSRRGYQRELNEVRDTNQRAILANKYRSERVEEVLKEPDDSKLSFYNP